MGNFVNAKIKRGRLPKPKFGVRIEVVLPGRGFSLISPRIRMKVAMLALTQNFGRRWQRCFLTTSPTTSA